MKIGIVTMSNSVNYGNKLQNYAVQNILENLGFKVETIKNFTNQEIKYKDSLKEKLKHSISRVYERLPYIEIRKINNILREQKFNEFTEELIKQTEFIITKDNIKEGIEDMFDYFVCGSDQIWNPNFDINSSIDFLTFAKKGQRIAYSPSFGVDSIPSKFENDYKNWIKAMDYLSVRENAGADIIKELTGREAEVLLDPTMMLTKKEWLKIAIKPKIKISSKYILTYFLGNKDINTECKIRSIAKENNLKIINLLDISNKYIYSVDPREFIWLINNCELLCTDSFHGGVFSLILKKPFIIFERIDKLNSMNSRLETLLLKFNMRSRLDKNIASNEEIFKINFNNVDNIINTERKKTINYLKKALNIE